MCRYDYNGNENLVTPLDIFSYQNDRYVTFDIHHLFFHRTN